MKKIVSGIQPSNNLTLGNFLGAIKYLVESQKNNDLYVFVADLHALSGNFDPKTLYQNKINLVSSYVAAGLNIKKTHIFFQSAVPAHCEINWILTCHTTIGELNRMTQFKDKTAKISAANGTDYIPTGLFMYPVLMAGDILLYDADYVIIGSDQKQHVELTRNIATRMNNKYHPIFKIPEPWIPKQGARIMDLLEPTIKMSKSNTNERGTIFLLDKPEVAVNKIMGAKTDSLNKVKYDLINQQGISNLINIYAALTDKTVDAVEKQYIDKSYGDFKKDLASVVSTFLTEFQKKYRDAINDYDNIDIQLGKHAKACQKIAGQKIVKIYKELGLIK